MKVASGNQSSCQAASPVTSSHLTGGVVFLARSSRACDLLPFSVLLSFPLYVHLPHKHTHTHTWHGRSPSRPHQSAHISLAGFAQLCTRHAEGLEVQRFSMWRCGQCDTCILLYLQVILYRTQVFACYLGMDLAPHSVKSPWPNMSTHQNEDKHGHICLYDVSNYKSIRNSADVATRRNQISV